MAMKLATSIFVIFPHSEALLDNRILRLVALAEVFYATVSYLL